MEFDPLGRAKLEDLGEVPGDRLALPVRVGGEDDLAVVLGRGPELVDGLPAALDHLVSRLEARLHVDRDLLFGQVADVAHRGKNVETVTQKPLQSPRLGGRLDDDQTFSQFTPFIPNRPFFFREGSSGGQSYARS